MMPYEKALEKEFEFEDEKAWMYGYYTYVAFGTVMSNAFSKKGSKSVEYPKEPMTQRVETREMTQEEFDALPPEEQERIGMLMWEQAMAGTIAGFEEGKENVQFTDD